MRKEIILIFIFSAALLCSHISFGAYHHEGELDAARFLEAYPDKLGTKLDHCALCHSGGSYDDDGDIVSLGSCQWCHYSYGYDGSGDIGTTMNPYGIAYRNAGRTADAIRNINDVDSDGDTYTNREEIEANRFPGDPNDDPSLVTATARVYTKAQLMAMAQHRQFLLMNASRSDDEYSEYVGVPVEQLLEDAGILDSATNIVVYAPDGWSNYHPLNIDPEPELYHVNGVYPASQFYYDEQADFALNPEDGWCDYSAPSCRGRNSGDPIVNPNGLRLILAYQRDGAFLDPGVLDARNRLDGEGPFRVVVPQKNPGPPDQSSRAANQDVIWPYNFDWDHNKGASSRSATIIKVEPLPEGVTDINTLEAGWPYIDQEKIVVYGAIDGTDTNGNGILDSEEGNGDFDEDGIPDAEDTDTASVMQSKGISKINLHTTSGTFEDVQALNENDPAVSQRNRPASTSCPYGAVSFKVTGLNPGETVTATLGFPGNIPTDYVYYKIDPMNGWRQVPFGSNDGDSIITLTLTDGDPETDGDGQQDGIIIDPGAITTTSSTPVGSSSGGGGGCYIATSAPENGASNWLLVCTTLAIIGTVSILALRRNRIGRTET